MAFVSKEEATMNNNNWLVFIVIYIVLVLAIAFAISNAVKGH